MQTKQYGACALVTSNSLIVAGGEGDSLVGTYKVAKTEVLNTLQWSTAVDLPQPTFCGSLLQVNDDQIYMVGAFDKGSNPIKLVYTCSLNALLQTCSPQSFGVRSASSLFSSNVWRRVANIPAIGSAYVSLHGRRLLAVGGEDSDSKPITAVHVYDPSSNSWKVISHMATPRFSCCAAVLPDNQLVVVRGFVDHRSTSTDSVEIATSLSSLLK